MRSPPSYQELTAIFDWNIALRELDYRPGDPINIAWMCSDRICQLGLANKLTLLREDHQGNEKRFTYDNVRIFSNTIARFLSDLGIRPGDRVWLFLDFVFPILIVSAALSGLAAHVLRYAGFALACHYAYALHVIVATPMLLIEMSFGKWSHVVYRPLALYFLAVQERATRQAPNAEAVAHAI